MTISYTLLLELFAPSIDVTVPPLPMSNLKTTVHSIGHTVCNRLFLVHLWLSIRGKDSLLESKDRWLAFRSIALYLVVAKVPLARKAIHGCVCITNLTLTHQ